MTSLIAEISEQVGRITILQEKTLSLHLRRENRIRTIHSSLAIEHNSLSLEQVTAIPSLVTHTIYNWSYKFNKINAKSLKKILFLF